MKNVKLRSIYLAAVCLSLSDNMPANVIYGGIVLVVSYLFEEENQDNKKEKDKVSFEIC